MRRFDDRGRSGILSAASASAAAAAAADADADADADDADEPEEVPDIFDGTFTPQEFMDPFFYHLGSDMFHEALTEGKSVAYFQCTLFCIGYSHTYYCLFVTYYRSGRNDTKFI